MPKQFEQLQQMELKANLNESQKEILEKLKAELEQIAAGRNAEEMAEQNDIKSLEMFVKKKREIMEFLETKKIPGTIEFHGIEIQEDHAEFIEDLAEQAVKDNLREDEEYDDLSEEEIRKREQKKKKVLINRSKIDENGFIIRLDCEKMNLTELPDLPQGLQDFGCEWNNLTELPELPQSLRSLYCTFNNLTELPELPQSLQILFCEENKLTELPDLPYGLEGLYCEKNKLRQLPNLSEGLQGLYCHENKLTELPDLPQSLKYMDCSKNPLSNKAIRKIRKHPNARNFKPR